MSFVTLKADRETVASLLLGKENDRRPVFRLKDRLLRNEGFSTWHNNLHPGAPLAPFSLEVEGEPPAEPAVVDMIGRALSSLGKDRGLEYGYVTGVASSGMLLAQSFARSGWSVDGTRGQKTLVVFEEVGGVDTSVRVTPDKVEAGKRLVLVTDSIREGDGVEGIIQRIKKVGLVVSGVLTFVDWQQGGFSSLERAGYNPHSLWTVTELIEHYWKNRRISPEQHQEIMDYLTAELGLG